MNIAIIDADLIGRTKHRFPNLYDRITQSRTRNASYSTNVF